MAVGEDVAAAVASGCGFWCFYCCLDDLVWHGVSPAYLSPKVFKRKGLPLDFQANPVKCEKPGARLGLMSFYCIELMVSDWG